MMILAVVALISLPATIWFEIRQGRDTRKAVDGMIDAQLKAARGGHRATVSRPNRNNGGTGLEMTSSRRTRQSHRWRSVALYAALVGTIALSGASIASATTITVDSLSDDTNAGHCTLREAINSANAAGGTGSCELGTGTDTIQFNVTGTITLGSTLPAITSGTSLTIIGPTSSPSGITIDGNNSVQIMQVGSSETTVLPPTLNLQYLTFAHGSVSYSAGGAILNFFSGTLVIANCAFLANHVTAAPGNTGRAGAIFNGGLAVITNSAFLGNQATGGSRISGLGTDTRGQGGAIQSWGPLTITNCTFSANQATGGAVGTSPAMGGAIDNENGNMTVTNTTFSGNQANGDVGWGGAVNGDANISNSTFSGNQANGDVYGLSSGGAISGGTNIINSTFWNNQAIGGSSAAGGGVAGGPNITNSTFSGNNAISDAGGDAQGGAIAGAANLKGTILAGNMPVNCASGIPTDLGYNLSDDKSQCGLIQSTSHNSVSNIGLASGLADNGGPTQTIALQPGGFANALIPVADCTDQSIPPQPLTTDQRGFPRPAASHSSFCSVGAFEYGDSAPTSTPTATPTTTPTPTPPTVPAVVHVSKPSVNFGNIKIGKSKTSVVKLTNTAKKGGATVIFSGATFTQSSSDFSVSTTCLGAEPPKRQCKVTLGFAPTAAGPETATVAVYSNASNSPNAIGVSGTGK